MEKLRAYLIEDEGDEMSSNDFGKNIIPKMLQNGEKMSAYRFSGYWKDVGTLDSLWDANMDMLAPAADLTCSKRTGRSTAAPPPRRRRISAKGRMWSIVSLPAAAR